MTTTRTPAPRRLNMADTVTDLAPKHPPCFPGQSLWVQYLISAAAAQTGRNEPKVILMGIDREPYFNTNFPMCDDCSQARKEAMQAEKRCNPAHLHQLTTTEKPQ
jgi:hypothetical protein